MKEQCLCSAHREAAAGRNTTRGRAAHLDTDDNFSREEPHLDDGQTCAIHPLLTETMLRDWVARSAWLTDRLAGTFDSAGAGWDQSVWARDRWCELAANGDNDRFRAYLARLGLDESDASRLPGSVQKGGCDALPVWADRLPELISIICSCAISSQDGEASPFSDLFHSLGRILLDRSTCVAGRSIWADSAREDVSAALTRRLSALFADSLYAWFDAFRAVRRSQGGLAGWEPESSHTELYADFLSWLQRGNLVRLLDQKPVLARLFAVCVLQWERHVEEFARRLEVDRPLIIARFFSHQDPGAVIELDFDAADSHNEGRGVVIVRFASGCRVVYKPRDLKIDHAWKRFLCSIQESGSPVELRAVDVLCRQGYGWASFIRTEPCTTHEEVRNFFRRAGALLALFQVLGSSDFHHENVIACRDYPIPVDLETLLCPGRRTGEENQERHAAIVAAEQLTRSSVLESGYLPHWNRFRSKKWTSGGLAWSAPETVMVTGYRHVNTDAMFLGRKPLSAKAIHHLPTLNGSVVDPSGFIGDIDVGLAEMGRFILAHRAKVREAMAVFRDTSVRVVIRATRFYEMLSRRALQPARLSNGLGASLEFEFLLRFHEPADTEALACVRMEQAALLRLDTPLFRMRSDGTMISEAGNEGLEIPYPGGDGMLSPVAHALSRLDELSETHLEQQRRLVRFTFSHCSDTVTTHVDTWPDEVESTWCPERAVRRALGIGEHLLRLAAHAEDGAAWLGLSTTHVDTAPQIKVLGENYYHGASGIALFMLALARVTGRDDFRETGLRAFAPLRQCLAHRVGFDLSEPRRILGGTQGLASCIYPLVLGAKLANCDELLEQAERIAECITDDLISSDTSYDVIGGAAGTILGLLALYAAGRPKGLDRALACGRHLLARCKVPTAGNADLPRPLAGMAHGAAGFAYALQCLAGASRLAEFATAASDWVAYERSLYDEASNNWKDLRFATSETPEPDTSMSRWCHGATGIGLARLGMQRYGADRVTEDMERAIIRTIAEPMKSLDSLCCGNFGRIDFLLEAGVRLGRPQLVELARRRASARLDWTEQGFHWPIGTDDENLGFFQGISGIGYELLRLVDPNAFPCALLWEARFHPDAGRSLQLKRESKPNE
jgi:type 2 lantibiotic biosynthesis protein LanM